MAGGAALCCNGHGMLHNPVARLFYSFTTVVSERKFSLSVQITKGDVCWFKMWIKKFADTSGNCKGFLWQSTQIMLTGWRWLRESLFWPVWAIPPAGPHHFMCLFWCIKMLQLHCTFENQTLVLHMINDFSTLKDWHWPVVVFLLTLEREILTQWELLFCHKRSAVYIGIWQKVQSHI